MIQPFYGNPEKHHVISRRCREDEPERLRSVFAGRNVCLVAQGESLLEEKRGGFVDTHDIVVRMNHFKVAGYEPWVGTRTTVHAFTNHSALHSRECYEADFYYCSDGFLIGEHDAAVLHDGSLLFWSRPEGNYDEFLRGKWPTTGLRILLDVLTAGASNVTLLGYDFYQNSCYYFAPMRVGEKPVSDGFKDWQPASTHDPAREKEYVEQLMAADKRIRKL